MILIGPPDLYAALLDADGNRVARHIGLHTVVHQHSDRCGLERRDDLGEGDGCGKALVRADESATAEPGRNGCNDMALDLPEEDFTRQPYGGEKAHGLASLDDG